MAKKRAFTKAVKIRPTQLDWLKNNRGRYCIAGKLDQIINFYKMHAKLWKTLAENAKPQ